MNGASSSLTSNLDQLPRESVLTTRYALLTLFQVRHTRQPYFCLLRAGRLIGLVSRSGWVGWLVRTRNAPCCQTPARSRTVPELHSRPFFDQAGKWKRSTWLRRSAWAGAAAPASEPAAASMNVATSDAASVVVRVLMWPGSPASG